MIALIGTILVWSLIILAAAVVVVCVVIGFLAITSFPNKYR